jgi:hypothetical protein
MSYSLKLANRDIAVSGSHLSIVQGTDKLAQDIDLWLREAYQVDRFHLSFGSILNSFIGGIIDRNTQVEVQAEILRVLQNYQTIQLLRFKANPSKFSPNELLNEVSNVGIQLSYDKILVTVTFTSVAGTTGTTNFTIA